MNSHSTNRIRIAALALAGALVLGACGQVLPTHSADSEFATGTATLVLNPLFQDGGFKAQAVIPNNYTRADINHLVVKVFKMVGDVQKPVLDANGNQVMVDIPNSDLDSPIVFTNLFLNTPYRIRCYAYQNPGTASADLISTTDLTSYSDITLTDDASPSVFTLKVRLADVIPIGEATASEIIITEGGYSPDGMRVSFSLRSV